MGRKLIILKKENGPRVSYALTLGLNTIILKHVYWYTYMQQISGERLQDHWSSGFILFFRSCLGITDINRLASGSKCEHENMRRFRV